MRICVACRAGLVRKPERQNVLAAMRDSRLMALIARHGEVRTRKRELGLLMLRDGEERPMKVAHGMARLAAIVVWRAGELTIVRILVAIRAARELHLVDRLAARG